MTLENINFVALFAGALLLMTRSGYRGSLWSQFKNQARSELKEKSRMRGSVQKLRIHVAPVLGAPDRIPASAANGAVADSVRSQTPAGAYSAIVTPYGGHSYGGYYG